MSYEIGTAEREYWADTTGKYPMLWKRIGMVRMD